MSHTLSPSHSTFAKVNEYLLYFFAMVIPFIILPFSSSLIEGSKFLMIGVMLLLTLPLVAVSIIRQKVLSITIHPFILPLSLYGLSILLSAFFSHPYPLESLTGIYGAQLALIVITLASAHLIHIQKKDLYLQLLAGTGLVLTALSFLQVAGIGLSRFVNPLFGWNFPHTLGFQLTGSVLVTFVVLLVIEVGLVTFLSIHRKFEQHLFETISVAVIGAGLLLHLYAMFVTKEFAPILLPFSSNWEMITELLKSIKTALLGVGPERFQDAYTGFKPVWHNTQSYWNVVFQTGSNTPLTDAVSIGLLGTVSWLLLSVQSLRLLRKTPKEILPLAIMTVSCLGLQFIIPANFVLLVIQFVSLIVWIGALKAAEHDSISTSHLAIHLEKAQIAKYSSFLNVIVAGVLVIVTLSSGYFIYRVSAAEFAYVKSLQAATTNDGTKTYDLQRQAIGLFPYKDQYHRSYAQTNFALANALSNQKDVSDAQKQTAVQLLQQAIREAKVATQLNPARTANWALTANIYRGLIGSITDSEKWAVAAYVKAIETDPNNPLLRIELGSVFYQQEDYNQAGQLFSQAVQLKPDLPGAYYNLGNALMQLKQFDQAVTAYQKTLTLLDPQSETYTQVESELGKALEQAKKTKEETKTEVPTDAPKESELPASVRNNQQLLDTQDELKVNQVASPSSQATSSAVTQ